MNAHKEMVQKVIWQTGFDVTLLLRLAYAYAKEEVPSMWIELDHISFVNHDVVPPPLSDFCLDILSKRIKLEKSKNTENGNTVVWIRYLKKRIAA
jgi:hypothetical protein